VDSQPTETADKFRRTLLRWAEENQREYPWRDRGRSFYEVFVAEFFLTQTPADNVAGVYPEFLEKYPSLTAVDEADPVEIEATIEPLGFQRMRTEALTAIAEQYHSLPREREILTDLPRIGPYVADATLCFALDRRLPIVDRNVVRVYDRLFGPEFPESDRERREFAKRMLPDGEEETRRYNLGLLDFGALVCEKQDPKCRECFASGYCRYYDSQAGATSADVGDDSSN
jgi:A/G-specific adenine glycosylase